MDDGFREFSVWEKVSRDTVDFKRIYVDMAGDLVAGLMLSQLVYWYLLPDQKGKSRLRVYRDGYWWVAKNRCDWWDEIRITPKQADRATKVLVDAGLVVKKNSMFNGKRTPHLRIKWDTFREAWRRNLPELELDTQLGEGNIGTDQTGTPVLTKESHRSSPKGNTGLDQRVIPITESTAKLTTEMTTEAEAAASAICSIHNVQMRLRIKNGDQWYSHQLANGTWCKGRPGDQPGNGRDNRQNHKHIQDRWRYAQWDPSSMTAMCQCGIIVPEGHLCPNCGHCSGCCECGELT